MKLILTVILVLCSNVSLALSPDSEINDELAAIYNQLVSSNPDAELVGRTYNLTLSLKHASKTHLIFNDAYISIDEKTRYQLAKWQFDEQLVRSVIGKRDISCKVIFVIRRVETRGVYSKMPHIVAEVLSVNAI